MTADFVLRVPRQAPPPWDVIVSQTRAWQTLKRDFPGTYRLEVAVIEEGKQAAFYGWSRR